MLMYSLINQMKKRYNEHQILTILFKKTLEKTEEEIENGQIQRQLQYWAHTQDTRRRQPTKKNIHTQNNIICVGNQYTQTATNNVKKT